MYVSTKTYGHELGLSVAFRQWRAESHCNKLHGYALRIRLEFEAETLDDRNWVVDFGGLKQVKMYLEDLFDHKTLVARDDPHLEWFQIGAARGVVDIIMVDGTGCEMMAKLVHTIVQTWLYDQVGHRVRLRRVEVCEHGANSAMYEGPA